VGAVGTSVAAMQGTATSLYTRTLFNATATQAANGLSLKLVTQYDDGFVAYINGVEVARRRIGLPNTFTPFNAVADSDAAVATETINLDVASRLLVAGANVLAVQTHNYAAGNADLLAKFDLQMNDTTTLVANAAVWKSFTGTSEPVPEPTGEEEDSTPEGPDSAVDWVELHNNGASAVSLAGWALSDDPSEPAKWIFPSVEIPAGGYVVVICDGLDITAPAPGGFLHSSFSLDADGETVGLYEPGGTLVSAMGGPIRHLPFHSLALDGGGAQAYSATPTPGSANAGAFFTGITATPLVSTAGGFFPGVTNVSLACPTAGATIRYTTDGSEPTATSAAYSGTLAFGASTALRARAFVPGMVPSETITHTYLIAQTGARQGLPAVCLTGDEQRSFYRPFGVLAISHNATTPADQNAYTGSIWSQYIGNTAANLNPPNVPPNTSAYNAPMQSGKPAERPVALEMLHAAGATALRTEAGLRTAGSPHGRPRYVLTNQNSATPNSASPWTFNSFTQKPQLNLFFRDDLGGSPLDYPLVAGSPITKYENIRLRAGKNDTNNPFIRDELCRRLMRDAGHVCVQGDFVNVYVNGVFKGYYNITQRPREPFFQQARKSDLSFDVRNITAIADGDVLAYNEFVSFFNTRNMAAIADYQAAQQIVDVVNVADYVLLNVMGANADWPGNNYVMDRERSTSGKWRFSIWDAEGGYGGFSRNPTYKSFNDLAGTGNPTSLAYSKLKQSPEFKILLADRIQRLFFNGGALTDANLTARYNELKARISPMIAEVAGAAFIEFMPDWLNGRGDNTRFNNGTNWPSRKRVLFQGYTDDTVVPSVFVPAAFTTEGIWPATVAPSFSPNGGTVAVGSTLTVSNSNGGGSVYYTTDGTDPRAIGGSPAGTLYTGPITIAGTGVIRARILSAGGEWSPLMEATFSTTAVAPLLITELMYHPPDFTPTGYASPVNGDEYEFIEIKNPTGASVNLYGMKFTSGVDFTFPPGATIPAYGFAVIAKNPVQFALKYPGVSVVGGYGPGSSLNNAGETVTLSDAANNTVFSVTYDDIAPWPTAPDGTGPSLVSNFPGSNPDPNNPGSWRVSGNANGSPGADDPVPGIPQIQITEILANSTPPAVDAIELYNPTTSPADIGGWYLSDDLATPQKYRIPDGTAVPALGYLVIDQTAFGTGPTPFALSQNGDEAVLVSANAAGTLTGYTEFVNFGASETGSTLGRYSNSQNKKFILTLARPTLGFPNAGPKVGPLVITEIHYQPSGTAPEFIEIRNNSNAAVPLFDPANPANTWRVTGIDYTLPGGVTLQPRQFIIISANAPASFRAAYGVNAAVQIFGPFNPADLANSGERVAIQKPGTPYVEGSTTVVPYVDVDFVHYSPASPWPTTPAGTGKTLERANITAFGDEPTSWKPSSSNGGNPGRLGNVTFANWQIQWFTPAELGNAAISGPNADADLDGLWNLLEYAMGLNPLSSDSDGKVAGKLANDGASGPYLMITFRRSLSTTVTTFTVEGANSPAGPWVPNSGTPLLYPQVGPAVNNGDGSETVTFRDSVTTPAAPQRHLRVKVAVP
jgi:CotH kinase protein/Chitobiase/beta-hexosaminidase C-terminal domain/Lamin Tail Domain